MVGEPRLTAQGSAGAALGGEAAGAVPAAGGAVMEAVALVVVACGVLATVESPEPQPVNAAASMTAVKLVSGLRQAGDHTSTHRTAIGPTGVTGVPACRLCSMCCPSPLDSRT